MMRTYFVCAFVCTTLLSLFERSLLNGVLRVFITLLVEERVVRKLAAYGVWIVFICTGLKLGAYAYTKFSNGIRRFILMLYIFAYSFIADILIAFS